MAISRPPGSAVLRIRLGARLRRLREARGITARQAARAIRASDSKISRIELGRHAAREIDVSDLLTLYGVTDPDERDELLGLASDALAPPWWQPYADVLPPWFQAYLGVEEAARSVQSYDSHFVPGLLQTPAYSAALIAQSGFAADEAEALITIAAERIRRFAASGWRLAAVIDEAVLRRPAGQPADFAAQLEHLREAASWPGVSIRIRPLSAGAPPVPAGFTIRRFCGDVLADAVYT
jgi:transcriptional regulator with XRE-family HTH domain